MTRECARGAAFEETSIREESSCFKEQSRQEHETDAMKRAKALEKNTKSRAWHALLSIGAETVHQLQQTEILATTRRRRAGGDTPQTPPWPLRCYIHATPSPHHARV